MPATKNKKVSPPKRGKRPSPTKNTKQNEGNFECFFPYLCKTLKTFTV